MSKLIDVINDASSTVVLECTRGHQVGIPVNARIQRIHYHLAVRAPRNVLYISSPPHWKIAAQKYQLKPIKDDSTKFPKSKSFAKP